jgi:hypothetical protein
VVLVVKAQTRKHKLQVYGDPDLWRVALALTLCDAGYKYHVRPSSQGRAGRRTRGLGIAGRARYARSTSEEERFDAPIPLNEEMQEVARRVHAAVGETVKTSEKQEKKNMKRTAPKLTT